MKSGVIPGSLMYASLNQIFAVVSENLSSCGILTVFGGESATNQIYQIREVFVRPPLLRFYIFGRQLAYELCSKQKGVYYWQV